jgi:hypothetical protein
MTKKAQIPLTQKNQSSQANLQKVVDDDNYTQRQIAHIIHVKHYSVASTILVNAH